MERAPGADTPGADTPAVDAPSVEATRDYVAQLSGELAALAGGAGLTHVAMLLRMAQDLAQDPVDTDALARFQRRM